MLITSADLGTNIYPEILAEIIRGDDTITDRAISTAIQEAKLYLTRYDLVQLFGDKKSAGIDDELLKRLVKDIACWHLLRLSNIGIDYSAYRAAYQDALTTLKNIQTGAAEPDGWPYAETTEETPPGNSIEWTSNPKRTNYY